MHCGIAGFSRLHTAGSHPQFQLRNAAGSAAAPSRGGQHPAGCGPYAAMRGVPRGGLCKGLPLDATLSHAPASRSVFSMLDGSSRSCGAAMGRTLSRACNNAALSTEAVAPRLGPLTCRFPFVEPLTLQTGERVDSARVIEAMSQFVAPARLARIDRVCLSRFAVLPYLFSLIKLFLLRLFGACHLSMFVSKTTLSWQGLGQFKWNVRAQEFLAGPATRVHHGCPESGMLFPAVRH